jgi:hypothetical protein
VGSTVTTLRLATGTSGASVPFAFGQAFRKGDVPTGARVATSSGLVTSFSADVRNRWPDGSVKFAVVAGTISVPGGTSSINLPLIATTQALPAVANITLADLKATGITASVAFGSLSASWSGAAWDTPHATVQSSQAMSSWTFRRALGTDAHLVAWLEVRCYAGGAVEVLPWIENGYLGVAGATLKAGRATFTLGGSLRYDSINDANTPGGFNLTPTVDGAGVLSMQHHSRHCLVRGGNFSYWLGSNPAVTPFHDRAYMVATKLVAAYHPTTVSESTLAAMSTTYNPGRVCYTNAGMGGTGYAPDIGLFTAEVGAWMASGDARAYRAVLSQGFSLGNYSIHYRDEGTNRTLLFASHPLKSLATDTGMPAWGADLRNACLYASSHHPAAAYLPYLLTGWNWYAEETQFQVTLHYLARNESYRYTSSYFFHNSAAGQGLNDQAGIRAVGWQWRTAAMCASITPDADATMRNQFVQVVSYNATRFRVMQDINGPGDPAFPFSRNLLGVGGWGYENVPTHYGTWQDGFLTCSVGLCWDLEVVTDATAKADLLWYRDFKYKAVVGVLGRQGVTTEHGFTRGATYDGITVGTGTGASFVWFTNWGQAWTASYGAANTDASANTLVGGNIDAGSDGFATSYWGNGMPAIAYAVDHGAPGAREAYNRMVGASNWAAKVVQFQTFPGWGIKPRSV